MRVETSNCFPAQYNAPAVPCAYTVLAVSAIAAASLAVSVGVFRVNEEGKITLRNSSEVLPFVQDLAELLRAMQS